MKNAIYVLNRDEQLVTILGMPKGCPFFDAPYEEELNGGFTFNFSIPADHPEAEHVTDDCLFMFKDPDGADDEFLLFEAKQPEEKHEDTNTKTFKCMHQAIMELSGEWIKDIRPRDVSAGYTLERILEGTRWQPGKVDDLGKATPKNLYYTTAWAGIQEMPNAWKGEYKFRVKFNGNKITGRFVDFLSRRGAKTGKRSEMGKDIKVITRIAKREKIVTALIGRGKGEEKTDDEGNETGGYGRRIGFEDVVWKKSDGKPYDKPEGQEWVGDEEARERYGRLNPDGTRRHIFDFYENGDQEDPEALLEETADELSKQTRPLVQYDMTGFDMEQLGLKREAVRLGDSIYAIDSRFKPQLRAETRIIKLRRYLDDPTKVEATYGDFFPVHDDAELLQRLQNKIDARSGIWDNKLGEGKPIDTKWLDGIIDVLKNEIRSENGYVYITDDQGIVVYNKPADQDPTKAIRLKGGILAIANSKDPETGDLDWRTFGTGDGFTADLINTGKLRASVVQVGPSTTFEDGYDPSTKVTPEAAQEMADDARVKAEQKADEAEQAAKAYAEAQDKLRKDEAEAYADGKVSEEEKARIAADKKALEDAKADAQEKADAAKKAAIEAAAADAEAKTAAAKKAAQEYADAQDQLQKDKLEAYADGKVTEEEQARIDADKENLDKAKQHAQETADAAKQAAEEYADQLTKDIDDDLADVRANMNDLGDYVDGAFKDGVLDASEIKRLKGYLDQIESVKSDLSGRLDSIYNNDKLTSGQKGLLEDAEDAFNDKYDALQSTINRVIKDGKVSDDDNQEVTNAIADFNAAVSDFSKALDNAADQIANSHATEKSDAAKKAAVEEAKKDAKAKAEAAKKAAQEYADAQDKLERDKAEAYADGKVTAEEQARIDADKKNLEEAKRHAQETADAAEEAAKKAAAADATNKANTAESKAKAYTDNLKQIIQDGGVPLPSSAFKGPIDIANNEIRRDSNFYWDKSGFYAVDPSNSNNVIRITSGGIGISNDGGKTFKTAMTGLGLTSEAIQAAIITADMLVMGNVDNLVEDPYFKHGWETWTPTSGAKKDDTVKIRASSIAYTGSGNNVLAMRGTDNNQDVNVYTRWIDTSPGEEFYMEAMYRYQGEGGWLSPSKAADYIHLQAAFDITDGGTKWQNNRGKKTVDRKWRKLTYSFKAPEGAQRVRFAVTLGRENSSDQGVYWDAIYVRRKITGKVIAGHIDAGDVNVGAYNGKKAVKITDKGLVATDSSGTQRFALLVRPLGGTNQDDPSTLIFFDGNGKASGSVGSNVNGDFIVGSTSGATEVRAKKNLLHYGKQIRFVLDNKPRYFKMLNRKSAKGNWNPCLEPDANAWGYIGTTNYHMYHIYSQLITKTSSRKMKKYIRDCDVCLSYNIIKGSRIRRYHYRRTDPEGNEIVEDKENFGVVSDEAPDEILDESKTGVEIYDFLSHNVNVTKDLIERVETLENEKDEANKRIANLENENAEFKKRLAALEAKVQ